MTQEHSPRNDGKEFPAGAQQRPTDGGPSQDVLQSVIAASTDAVCFVDRRSSKVTYANRAALELFGYDSRESETLYLSDLVCGEELRLDSGEEEFAEYHTRNRGGHVDSVLALVVGSPANPVAAVIFRSNESTDVVSKNDRDPLTRLPNRAIVEHRLTKVIDRNERNFAVLFVDLDNFKEVNDRLGHTCGDQVLRIVAERLRGCLRPVDLVARYGGDEFVVVLDGITGEDAARNAAGRLLCAIDDPVGIEELSIRVSASIGILLGNRDFNNVAEVISQADRAMYRAKALGRRRYVVFDERDCPSFRRTSSRI